MAAKKNRFIDTASASALVRFGPELSALRELMATSQQGYRQQAHAASAGAAAIQAAAATGLQQLKGVYADSPTYGIPGLSRQQALNDMIGRGVSAQEGAVGQRRLALSNLRADEAKISGRRSDIAQEIGAFTTSEADKLSSAAADRELRNRISQRSATATVTAAKIRSAGKTGPGGVKLQTQAAHSKLASQVSDARDLALRFAKTAIRHKGAQTRNFVDAVLRTGVDEPATRVPVYETVPTATGSKRQVKLNPDNTPVYKVTPATKVPKVNALARGAALDLVFDGHVSAAHVKALHQLGYSVNQLGLPTRRNPQAPQVRLPRPQTAAPYVRRGPRVA